MTCEWDVHCRKMVASRGMLNRGEAPSAQLFAISEEAEIRYTKNGMLYEVPADETLPAVGAVTDDPCEGLSEMNVSDKSLL